MAKRSIEINIPDGYEITSKPSAILIPPTCREVEFDCKITIKKINPCRRVFEETGELKVPIIGDWFYDRYGSIIQCGRNTYGCKYHILKEVTEE